VSFGWRANLRAKAVRRSPKGEGGWVIETGSWKLIAGS